MTYYQLLRQRRIGLNLSIQDVSNQTRLAPEYILAIEEHNLDVFSDDFSFVRYFVHAYCDAIGVNWSFVQNEVDQDIHAYARMRDHALTQAQKKIVSSMKPQESGRRRKKKKGLLENTVSQLTYRLQETKRSKYYRLIVLGVAALIVLAIVNTITGQLSNAQASSLQKQQEEEYAAKEKETEELAQQYASEKKKKEGTITCTDSLNNEWAIKNLEDGEHDLTFTIILPESSTVEIYQDDTLMTGDAETVYSDKLSKQITVKSDCTIELRIGTYSENVEIQLNDTTITFDTTQWEAGTPAVITFNVSYASSSSSTTKTTDEETDVTEEETEEYDDTEYSEDGYYYTDEGYYDQEGNFYSY